MKSNLKSYSRIAIFLIILTGFTQCNKKPDKPDYYVNTPIAGFGWQGNDGPAPVTVKFHNSSENADSFHWDFGDGVSSDSFEPEHTYHNNSDKDKNYTVVLTATDSGSGLFQKASRVIQIQAGG
jgi:PKD repeat protein